MDIYKYFDYVPDVDPELMDIALHTLENWANSNLA